MSSESDTVYDCIVVGAGIAGLMCASQLRSGGFNVLVLDKGRGVGGRMSTYRRDELRFDHGAQVVGAHTDRFADLLRDWAKDGVVRIVEKSAFAGQLEFDYDVVYSSSDGMNSIPKSLATGLEIWTRVRAESVALDEDLWRVAIETGPALHARSIVLTTPIPQALGMIGVCFELIGRTELHELGRVRYEKCLALMSMVDRPLDFAGCLIPDSSKIKLIVDNHSKGVSSRPGAITIHATPEYSESMFAGDQYKITLELNTEAAEILGVEPEIVRFHKWRFSRVVEGLDRPYLMLTDPAPLVFAGDAFHGGDIEGAALSGIAAGEAMSGILSE